jgi:hypothetical protein
MFGRLLILSILIILASLLLLGLRTILKNRGKFPQFHVGRNREMRKRGISCAQDTDVGCNPSIDSGSCITCGRAISNLGDDKSKKRLYKSV